MRPLRSFNLRTHLLIIVLVSFLPAVALAVWLGFLLRANMADSAKQENLRIARVLLLDYEGRIALAHNTLATLANSSQVTSMDLKACSELFRKTCAQNGNLTVVLLANPAGRTIAGSVDDNRPIDVSDRAYFQDAMRTRRFTIGGYIVGRGTGKSVRPMALPVLDADGMVKAVLITGLDLGLFGQALDRVSLPAGARVTVFDGDGVILFSYPHEQGAVGASIAAQELETLRKGSPEGTYLHDEGNGLKRLCSHAGSGGEGAGRIFARVSVAQGTVYARADQFLLRQLIGISFITLLMLLLARYVSTRIILAPMKRLIAAAEGVENGRLQTRTGVPYDMGDLGRLARAFDTMTDALAQRERQRDIVEGELRTAEENLSATLSSIADAVICTDKQMRIVRMNPVAETLTGWPFSMARGKQLTEVFHLVGDRARRHGEGPVYAALLEGNAVPVEESLLLSRQGKEYRVSTSAAPIRTKDGIVAGAVLVFRRIATEREARA